MIRTRRRGMDFQIACSTFFGVFMMMGRTKMRQSRIWRLPFGQRVSQHKPRKVSEEESDINVSQPQILPQGCLHVSV